MPNKRKYQGGVVQKDHLLGSRCPVLRVHYSGLIHFKKFCMKPKPNLKPIKN